MEILRILQWRSILKLQYSRPITFIKYWPDDAEFVDK